MADEKEAPLGAKVAETRKSRGMTQEQLAGELRVKQASLSMIENGELEVSSELRDRINGWIASGKGPRNKAPRGPYHKTYEDGAVQYKKRTTIEK